MNGFPKKKYGIPQPSWHSLNKNIKFPPYLGPETNVRCQVKCAQAARKRWKEMKAAVDGVWPQFWQF